MAPFDLVKAIKGEEILTREGEKARVRYIHIANIDDYPVRIQTTDNDYWVSIEGKFGEKDHHCDIFMAPKKIKKTFYFAAKLTEEIKILASKHKEYETTNLYDSREHLIYHLGCSGMKFKWQYHEIELEVEI